MLERTRNKKITRAAVVLVTRRASTWVSMSGTLDLLQRSYVGARGRDGVLHFNPKLTDRLAGLTLPMQFRGKSIRASMTGDELTVRTLAKGFSRPVRIGIRRRGPGAAAGEKWVAPLGQRRGLPEDSVHNGER